MIIATATAFLQYLSTQPGGRRFHNFYECSTHSRFYTEIFTVAFRFENTEIFTCIFLLEYIPNTPQDNH